MAGTRTRRVITSATTRQGLTSLWVVGLLSWALTLAVAGDLRAAAEPESMSLRPNAERPLTHEELLALRGERGRSEIWGTDTLVAEIVLEREQPMRGGDEWSGEGPAFGVIPRRDAHPGSPVVLASAEVAAQYPPDDSPISGLLAISDTRWEGLQLQGTVETPAGSYLTPIEPVAMATAAALPPRALIVVHGSFSIQPSSSPCPEVTARDPNDAGDRYSPFMRCPGGWLTAADVTEFEPEDRAAPFAFGIPVQAAALDQFGRGAPTDPSAPANYLLRHVANPVDGADPATGWQVIGRVGPVTVPDLEPAADADTVARPGGLDWQPGMERQPPADMWGLASTAWAGGFASVHLGADRVYSAWVSPDGSTWQGEELPSGIRTVSGLLRLGDGLVLIANELRFDEPWRYEVWSSADGLVWEQVALQQVAKPNRYNGNRRVVHGFWSLDDRVVALETYTASACCGSSSGWALLANEQRTSDVTFAWTSRDGVTWDRHRTRGFGSDEGRHLGHLVKQGDGELFGLWEDVDGSIARTTDGIRWRTIGRYPRRMDITSVPILLVRSDEGFVLGGSVEVPGRNRQRMTFWRSTDARRWQPTFERFGGRPVSMVSDRRSVIVAGNDGYSRGTGTLPWLMVSADGGRTWDQTLGWVGDADWCLESLTTNDQMVLLDAACATPEAASTYVVTLPANGSRR